MEVLLLLFNGTHREHTLESYEKHVLRRVNDFVFRDVQGIQSVAWKEEVPPTKKPRLLGPSAVADVFPDFDEQETFAWFHFQRPLQFLHLGLVSGEPRVVFQIKGAQGPSFSSPHGSWSMNRVLREVLGEDVVSFVAKDCSVLQVHFHCRGDMNKAWTMYCGSLTDWPRVRLAFGFKKQSGEPRLYSDTELGEKPWKNIYAVEV